jgi:hypothetical protein
MLKKMLQNMSGIFGKIFEHHNPRKSLDISFSMSQILDIALNDSFYLSS